MTNINDFKKNELSLCDIEEVINYFKNNRVVAYGNGSSYEKTKCILKIFNLEFYDVLITKDHKIISISGKNYEDIVKNSSILICSSFYEDIIKIIKNHKEQPLNIFILKNPSYISNESQVLKRYISNYMKNKHKELLLNLKNKSKIKVLFLTIYKSVWKVDLIFQEMLNSSDFEPIILVCPEVRNDKEKIQKDMKETFEHFKNKNYPVIFSYNEEQNSWIKLDEIKPDIIFFTNPHGITKTEYYEYAFLNYLSCYAGYGIHVASYNNNQSQYNQLFHNAIWKIFVQTKDMFNGYLKYSFHTKKNTHLVLDNIISQIIDTTNDKKETWKNHLTHKKIIYAPHHTINNDFSLQLSSFLIYAKFMQKLALKTKDSVSWAFKPHPLLKQNLYKHPHWGKEKTDEYYKFWENNSNTQFEDSEYIELFKQSDAIIHDSASFLIEYIFTNKPMLYLMTNHTKDNLNQFGHKCLSVVEKGFNENDIESFLSKILNNSYKQSKKINKFIKDFFTDLKENNNKSAIINILKDSIKGEI